MGFSGFFKGLTKAAFDTAMLPMSVIKDAITGDFLFDEDGGNIVKKVKQIQNDLKEARESLDE